MKNKNTVINKIISILMILIILISLMPNVSKADEENVLYENNGVKYVLYNQDTLVITGDGMLYTVGNFHACKNVKKVFIDSNIFIFQGKEVFNEVYTNLEEFEVHKDNQDHVSEDGVLFSKDKKTLVAYPISKTDTTYVVPEGVENIDYAAFRNCTEIKNIILPESLIHIDMDAFEGCSNLTDVTILSKQLHIEDHAFYNCENLSRITFSKGKYKFGMNDLGNGGIFYGCNNLVIYGYEGSRVEEYANENGIKFEMLPDEDEENPITIDGITYLLDEDNKTAKVTEVKGEAISSDGKLFFPDKIESKKKEQYIVTEIGAGAVTLEGIQSIRLPEELTTLRYNAFEKYTGDVFIPKNVSDLDINAFATHEVNISIDEENKNFFIAGNHQGLYSTRDKPSILYGFMHEFDEERKLFTLAECVTEIGDRAFKYCNNFKKIKIGAQVNKIGYDAFDGIEDKVTIQGYNNSYAQRYATQHNINFESLGEYPYFRWTKDNYSFINSSYYISSYDIGEFEKYLSNSLLESYKKKKEEVWEGSCFGMAATALLFRKGHLNQDYWQYNSTENEYTYDLTSPITNEKLKWLINLYQFFQVSLKINNLEKIDSDDAIMESVGQFINNKLKIKAIQKAIQIDEIKDFYNKVKQYYEENEQDILLCSYNWGEHGHEVLITDKPEEIDDSFYNEREWDFNSNDYYGYRIPIYDVNESQSQQYIYIKNDFSSFALGSNEQITKTFSTTADDNSSSENVSHLIIGAYKFKYSDLFNIENIIKYGEDYEFGLIGNNLGGNYIEYKNGAQIKITDKNDKYVEINGLYKIDGDLECRIEPMVKSSADNENSITEIDAVLKEDEKYSVEPINNTDPLDVNILMKDSYMTSKTTAGGKATFENKKAVSLSNPTGQEFETKITLNEEYVKLPWYTITATGKDAKEIKIEMTDEGALITGDNLKNVTVKGNNLKEQAELNISTDKTQVLIKASEDKTKMIASIDKDEDGIYETIIKEAKSVAITDNTEAPTKLPNTGINTILTIIIGLVAALGLLFALKYFKLRNI